MPQTDRANRSNFRFLIEAFDEGQATDLTVAEAGVFLTAVNRSVNGFIAESGEVSPQPATVQQATQSAEPDLIQLVMLESRHGSLEVQAAIDLLNAIGLDPATAKSILTGILGAAIWDPEKSKRIAKDFGRAVRRLGRGAKRRTYRLTMWVNDKKRSFTARISEQNRVDVDDSSDDA